MSKKKPGMTRRLKSQYDAIIRGDASAWFILCPGWAFWDQPAAQKMGHCSHYRNEWAAYTFACQWTSRSGVDVKKLQLIVIRSGNAECAWRFARDVEGANVKRLQKAVLENGNPRQIRLFAALVPGADRPMLENIAFVAEVLAV